MGFRRKSSEARNVPSSEKDPSSNTRRNSTPSSRAWMECGTPAGKNQTSPAEMSSMKDSPFSSTAARRTEPLSTRDHSFAVCQCNSRYAWGARRMSTPAIAVARGSCAVFCWRAHPDCLPEPKRLCERPKGHCALGSGPEDEESVPGGA